MAWIYLAESEDSPWPCHLGLNQLPIVKSSDTHKLCYCSGCGTVNFQELLSGTTSPLSYLACCPEVSTSSTEDSHARTYLLQEMEEVWQESEADYFSRLLDLRKKSNLHSFFSKMYQPSHQGEELKSLIKLPKWGMIVAGLVYPLRKLERITKEKDGGYLPTPDASARGPTKTYDPKCKSQSGRTLQSYAAMFPTPQASDHRNRGNLNNPSIQRRVKLGKQIGLTVIAGGQLNPQWVEWLMGYPTEWTGLKDWAMQWFRCKPEKRLRS